MKRLLFIMVMSVGFGYAQETPVQVKLKKATELTVLLFINILVALQKLKILWVKLKSAAGMEVEGYSEYLHYGNYTTVFEFFTEKKRA